MSTTSLPTIHEVRVFSFGTHLSANEQKLMVRQIAAVRDHIDGLSEHEYFFCGSHHRWIEHLIWVDGKEPREASGLSAVQAMALLDRLWDEIVVEQLCLP